MQPIHLLRCFLLHLPHFRERRIACSLLHFLHLFAKLSTVKPASACAASVKSEVLYVIMVSLRATVWRAAASLDSAASFDARSVSNAASKEARGA